jgi:amidase
MKVEWKTTADTKKDAIFQAIPPEWRLKESDIPSADQQRDITGSNYIHRYLSAREIEITETDAVGIVSKTTTGAWKAEEVTRAFCHRAALAHQLVNCLLEIFFDAAIADAKELDAEFEKSGKPRGVLHGLPVSLKDQFHIKGVETSMGYVGWIGTFEGKKDTGKEKNFESEMVRELRDLGAVLYVKTSVPHTLMCGETSNNIVGYCWNPRNRLLSAGGSSGGEGALIALRGSPVGFGTDIGGSIRIPAAFCGIFGIRPSTGRFPYEGMANSMDGQNSVKSVVGPMATSIGGLKLVTKALLSQEPWFHDPYVNELPWRDEVEKEYLDLTEGKRGKMAFGIMKGDGVVGLTPPMERALDMVVEAVKKLGHEVIEWNPPSHEKINACSVSSMDRCLDLTYAPNDDPVHDLEIRRW